jgi:hypothetical protein
VCSEVVVSVSQAVLSFFVPKIPVTGLVPSVNLNGVKLAKDYSIGSLEGFGSEESNLLQGLALYGELVVKEDFVSVASRAGLPVGDFDV